MGGGQIQGVHQGRGRSQWAGSWLSTQGAGCKLIVSLLSSSSSPTQQHSSLGGKGQKVKLASDTSPNRILTIVFQDCHAAPGIHACQHAIQLIHTDPA